MRRRDKALGSSALQPGEDWGFSSFQFGSFQDRYSEVIGDKRTFGESMEAGLSVALYMYDG